MASLTFLVNDVIEFAIDNINNPDISLEDQNYLKSYVKQYRAFYVVPHTRERYDAVKKVQEICRTNEFSQRNDLLFERDNDESCAIL